MNKKQMKELENLCEPLAKWAEKNLTPHDHIVINAYAVRVVSEVVGVPFPASKPPLTAKAAAEKQHQIWKRQFEEDCKIREEATKKVLSFAEKLKKPEGLFARFRKWAGWS